MYHIVFHRLLLVIRDKWVTDSGIYWRTSREVSLQPITEDVLECHHGLATVTKSDQSLYYSYVVTRS